MSNHAIDETGKRYGRLLVLRREGNKGCAAAWRCRCDCGKETVIRGSELRKHRGPRSCGWTCPLQLEESALNRFHHRYRQGALNRGLVWGLTVAQFRHLVKSDCHYCGVPASPRSARLTNPEYRLVCNGIDRVDNARGYTRDNVVPCCSICNQAKHKLSYKQFIDWIERLVNRWPDLPQEGPFKA